MQFYISSISFSVDLDGCTSEVRTFAKIPVAGLDYFQVLIVLGFEMVSAKQRVVPDAAEYFFGAVYRVVFFSNFKLI
jgi:hypothetical protein